VARTPGSWSGRSLTGAPRYGSFTDPDRCSGACRRPDPKRFVHPELTIPIAGNMHAAARRASSTFVAFPNEAHPTQWSSLPN
jgi:hypothetical protein